MGRTLRSASRPRRPYRRRTKNQTRRNRYTLLRIQNKEFLVVGLKFRGGFKPATGALKVSNSIPPHFFNGVTVKGTTYHTPQPGLLHLPNPDNNWMGYDGTQSTETYYTPVAGLLTLPSPNNIWMTGPITEI